MANKITRHRKKCSPEEAFEGDLEMADATHKSLDSGVKANFYRDTEYLEISSDDYVIMDSDVAKLIRARVSESDFSKLVRLSVYLSSKYNILLNHKIPFTQETLSEFLGLNRDNTVKFVRRMTKQGVMVYTVCAPSGYERKVYIMNPQLFRKGKLYHDSILNVYFPSFTKDFVNVWDKDGVLSDEALRNL